MQLHDANHPTGMSGVQNMMKSMGGFDMSKLMGGRGGE